MASNKRGEAPHNDAESQFKEYHTRSRAKKIKTLIPDDSISSTVSSQQLLFDDDDEFEQQEEVDECEAKKSDDDDFEANENDEEDEDVDAEEHNEYNEYFEENLERKREQRNSNRNMRKKLKEPEEPKEPKKIKEPKKNKESSRKEQKKKVSVKIDTRAIFDPEYVKQLAIDYPDTYWKDCSTIGLVNRDTPLELVPEANQCVHSGHIYSMCFSHDGLMLATCSSLGTVRIYDTNTWEHIQELRDSHSEEAVSPGIEEYYALQFSPDDKYIAVGGKCKDRYQWDAVDDDNKILHCPLKIYRIQQANKPVAILHGHTEEILCLKAIWFRGKFYYVTGSYDGSIRKWKMENDFVTLKESIELMDGVTNEIHSIAFVPNTGNKYFIAGCDDKIKIYDFEHDLLLQTFESGYGTYCDCIKFIPQLPANVNDDSVVTTTPVSDNISYHFITRGVELVNDQQEPIVPNTCNLRKLVIPATKGDPFVIETVRTFEHAEYISNCWLVKFATNGRYLFAPTSDGRLFIFSIATGKVTAILHEHDYEPVRDVIIHPFRKLLLTCGDDSNVKVFRYANIPLPQEQGKLNTTTPEVDSQ